jgi:hypothetical protein
MENRPQDLINNIDYVTKLDVPGSLIVYGSHSFPLLAFNDLIIFAGAQYGLGRVFVTSHEKYVSAILKNATLAKNEFEKIWLNLNDWFGISLCSIEDIKNVANIDNMSTISTRTKLLYWIGTYQKSNEFLNDLKSYIKNGGNLVCGVCPWGWLLNSPGKTLEDLSLNTFIRSIGICFTSKPLVTKAIHIPVLNYDNLIEYHLCNAFKILTECSNNAKTVCSTIQNALEFIPNDFSIKYSIEIINKFERYAQSTDSHDHSILLLLSTAYKILSSNGFQVKAPCLFRLSGEFLNNTKHKFFEPIITITSKLNEFHFTGYYLPAGCAMTVNILEGFYHGWSIRIGCHIDSRLLNQNSTKRFQIIHTEMKLKNNLRISNAFGGIVYLISPNGSSFLKIKLQGVIETPFYDVTKKESIVSWKNIKNFPGLWTELLGYYIIITLPSVYAKKIQDPSKILELWDKFILHNHEFKGTSVENSCKIRLVADVQVEMPHGGYPIFIPMKLIKPLTGDSIFSEKIFEDSSNWKLFHQISHFFTNDIKLPKPMLEFITNVFTLYSFEASSEASLSIESLLTEEKNLKIIDDYFNNRSDDLFNNPPLEILFVKQFVNSFGWDSFKIFFREFLSQKERPLNRNQFLLYWIELYSNIVQKDVTPLFYFWNINVTKSYSKTFRSWLPNDFITRRYSSRLTATLSKYNL